MKQLSGHLLASKVHPTNDELTIALIQCPFCKRVFEIEVNKQQLLDYINGQLAQKAFPDMHVDIREMFISGICNDCWNDTMGE